MVPEKHIECLVLDATPLITQPASALQQHASKFYTTPGVRAELRDEHARNQLLLWGDNLNVRQPTPASIDRVSAFAKLTGDFSVLSMNDVHIIALAYELEHERNGDSHLRKFPGEKLASDEDSSSKKQQDTKDKSSTQRSNASNTRHNETQTNTPTGVEEDDGFQIVTRKKNRKPKREPMQRSHNPTINGSQSSTTTPVTEVETKLNQVNLEDNFSNTEREELHPAGESEHSGEHTTLKEDKEVSEAALEEEYNEEDDDGEWITPGNLHATILKDNNESVQDAYKEEKLSVAISTGDFACQNVSMQLGLNLMNHISGKQIKRVRNYMYRCHACFAMVPMPKSGVAKHFCPKCGGNTLLRCAVSIDSVTGKVTPHLKRNFQWITKGQVYSLPSPLSKSTKKQQGRAGYQHNKENRHKNLQEPLILREDQKEYAQALKDDAWHRRKSEKMLQDFTAGGSADNIISPFSTSNRSSGVRVGRGRSANAVKGKRK